IAKDILSIPSILAKVERLFSSAKLIIPLVRNSLDMESIEARECIRSFRINGVI
ncbi:hypothetical protein L207DRAFT_622131, partial [Hyaloscypha variabilis F]